MSTFPVTSNLKITLQAYSGGPAYPGAPQPLGTPWLTEWTLSDGTTDVDNVNELVALLTADPPCISCPGLTVNVGGVEYNF